MDFYLYDIEYDNENNSYILLIISLLIIYSTAISVMFITRPEKSINNEELSLVDDELSLVDDELSLVNEELVLEFINEEEKILSKCNLTNCTNLEREFVCKNAYKCDVNNAFNNWKKAYKEWWTVYSKHLEFNYMLVSMNGYFENNNINSISLNSIITNIISEETTYQLTNKEKLARKKLVNAIEKDKLYNELRWNVSPDYLSVNENEMLSNLIRIKKDIQILVDTY